MIRSYKEIMELPAYQELMSIGCVDIGSSLLRERGNIKFTHSSFGNLVAGNFTKVKDGPAFIQIYQNGPVRAQKGDRQYKLDTLLTGELRSKEDYNNKIVSVRKYIISRILRDDLGVKSVAQRNDIANKDTVAESIIEMFKQLPSAMLQWLKDQDETTQAGFLGAEGIEKELAKQIIKAPGKYAILLKSAHKAESVRKAIALLPPEMSKSFSKDLGLMGDLNTLGIA